MSISAIFYKEITENILTFRNVITTVLCLVLFVTSIILLYHDYSARLTNHSLRNIDGHLSTEHHPRVAKKPTPLSFFARGLDPNMGRLTRIWSAQPFGYPGGNPEAPAEGNYLSSLFPVPDSSYVVRTVMSLLALLFAFDAICGEKERGTLRLMIANNVSRGEVLLGKWLGGYISFLLCVLPGLVLMLIVITLLPMVSLDGEDWLRVGMILMLAFIYLSLFSLLGLFVSARVHRSETALVLILLIWMIWVVGVPNFGPFITKWLYSTPVAQHIHGLKQQIEGTEEWRLKQCRKLDDEALRMVRNRATLAQHLSRLSPLGSFVAAVTTMAKTGVEDTHRYKAYVMHWDRQRRVHEGFLFAPTEMTFRDSFAGIIVDLGLLILLNVVFFMGACLSFLRYDIR
jgi:ABC-type transport system involved in multi-copper enzyme maturation permease subunit